MESAARPQLQPLLRMLLLILVLNSSQLLAVLLLVLLLCLLSPLQSPLPAVLLKARLLYPPLLQLLRAPDPDSTASHRAHGRPQGLAGQLPERGPD